MQYKQRTDMSQTNIYPAVVLPCSYKTHNALHKMNTHSHWWVGAEALRETSFWPKSDCFMASINFCFHYFMK